MLLDEVLQEASNAKTNAKRREKAWSRFNMVRYTTVDKLWKDLLRKLKIFGTNSLLLQSVTQELFEARMKVKFVYEEVNCTSFDANITEDEKNVMYATTKSKSGLRSTRAKEM